MSSPENTLERFLKALVTYIRSVFKCSIDYGRLLYILVSIGECTYSVGVPVGNQGVK